MKVQDLLAHYKTAYRAGMALSMPANNIHHWVKWGYIPIAAQFKIERLTNGLFKADINDIDQNLVLTQKVINKLKKG